MLEHLKLCTIINIFFSILQTEFSTVVDAATQLHRFIFQKNYKKLEYLTKF